MAKLTIKDALSTSLTRTKQYIDTELAKKANSSHGTHLTLGTGSGNAFRGDYGNTAYQHSQTAHAPSNAQKNSDITKAEIEAKLTGAITSHTHSYLPLSGGQVTGKVYLTTGATSTDASHPTQLAYGLLGAYGTLKVLGNTDTSAGADNEYVHIASGWGLNPDANKGITVHGTYANCFGKKISTEGHTHDHLKVQLNGGTTEGTNQFTFDGSAAKTINITPSSIGAAPTSHASTATTYGAASASNYGHAIASSTTPKANGTAAVGNETAKFARGDHVHPLQTTVSGNAGTATKLATARTINGTNFDGSANITTANWGTARTLTIGNKGQSVNGSGNVSWALSDIMGRATTTSSADTNKNKYTKFARVDISGGAYRSCTGTFDFVSVESGHVFGILTYYLRTGSAITSTSITLAWKTLTNVAYASSVVAVKVSDGIFDLYYKPVNDWDTMSITNINSNGIGYITLYSSQSFVSSVTATATSSLVNHSATAAKLTTARSITIGNKSNNFDGSGNISFTLSDIGAAAAHNHPYLPTAGGTMTGKITTPNNAQGITIGDDVSLCDRNIADHLVLEGSTATNGGITFGSGKDTNIYRGGANLLKTDDTMNAVGGFQWNGQSLDNRYAASSHGTHVSYGGNGSATTVSRSDHTHDYLPKSGGTISGNVYFADVTSTTYPAKSATLTWNGSTDGADIYYQVDASDKGRLVLNTRDDADCVIAFANKGTIVSTIDNSGNFSGKAATATKATQDSAGQQINTTYIKGLSVSGKTITYTKGDGSTGTITTQDTNTTYSTGTASALGLTKLYTGTGTATDGTMTQAAIKSALDGKAGSSHGTHVSYGGNGSATTVSRSDHTHSYLPLSGGTVTGATTFNNYLKINAWSGYGTGTADIWYDGTNKTVEIDGVTDLKLGETKVTKGAYTIWTGSQTDYNNISSKSSTTLYFIK